MASELRNPTPLRLPPLEASVGAGRVPSWNLAEVKHRSCPVCGDDAPELVCYRPDKLGVARCAGCEMIYLPEIPAPAEISNFYETYGHFKGLGAEVLSRSQLVRAALADRNIVILEASGGLKGSTLVEIGCSHGRFLQLARYSGAKVTGIEVDAHARSTLQRLNIENREVLNGNEQAEVVCAFQLVEHLANPQELFSKVSESLVEDGRLLLALPNGGEFEQVGESWIGFRADLEHFNYFNVKTLARLLVRNGLFVEHFWVHSQPSVARSKGLRRRAPTIERAFRKSLRRALEYPAISEIAGNGSYVLTVLARKTRAMTSVIV
jgi:SAM-dependent methyltransferase